MMIPSCVISCESPARKARADHPGGDPALVPAQDWSKKPCVFFSSHSLPVREGNEHHQRQHTDIMETCKNPAKRRAFFFSSPGFFYLRSVRLQKFPLLFSQLIEHDDAPGIERIIAALFLHSLEPPQTKLLIWFFCCIGRPAPAAFPSAASGIPSPART